MPYREKEIEKLYYSVREVSEIVGVGIIAIRRRLAKIRCGLGIQGKRKHITFKELQSLTYKSRKWKFLELRGMNSND